MRLIEKEAGLEGLILRPLSAKLLPPSIPEREGWVDRETLLSIQGRSRKPQIQLAAIFGIQDYPCPAGGCLLTDPGFAEADEGSVRPSPRLYTQRCSSPEGGEAFSVFSKGKADRWKK